MSDINFGDAHRSPRAPVTYEASTAGLVPAGAQLPVQPLPSIPVGHTNTSSEGHYSTRGTEDAEGFGIRDFVQLLLRRRRLIGITFFVIAVTGILLTVFARPIYQSQASMRIATSGPNRGAGDFAFLQDMLGNTRTQSIETETEVIKSTPVVKGAVERLPANLQKAINEYKVISVRPERDTEIVKVTCRSYNPRAAAAMANLLCAEYIARNQEINTAEISSATEYVWRQLQDAKKQLNETQLRLLQYKQRYGTVELESEARVGIQQLSEIQAQIRQAQAESSAARAQVNRLRSLASSVPATQRQNSTTVPNPVVTALQQELTQLNLQRIQLEREYAPGSPELRAIGERISEVRSQLERLPRTSVGSVQEAPNPVRQNIDQTIANAAAQIQASEARVRQLQSARVEAQNALNDLPKREYDLTLMTSEAQSLQRAYELLADKYQQLRIQEKARVSTARVIEEAQVSPRPVSPRRTLNFTASIVLGLLFAIILATVVDALDKRIYTEEEAERATGRPVLTYVPLLKDLASQSLLESYQKPSPLLEGYRMLRANIAFSAIDEPIRSVALTSSQPNEGKSTAALNLAIVMALDGKRVALLDCDLRRPSVHRLLNVPNQKGFSNVAAGACTLDEALQETSVPNLWVLTAGPTPPNPPELLNSRSSQALMRQIVDRFDFVVVDTPPALAMADAQIVAAMVDSALLVVSSREASRDEVARTAEIMNQTGTKLLGTVLNKLVVERISNYYGGYGRYGYYGYSGSHYHDHALELAQEQGENGSGPGGNGSGSNGANGHNKDGSVPALPKATKSGKNGK